jgi:putative ABC transport system substrate-binding protein
LLGLLSVWALWPLVGNAQPKAMARVVMLSPAGDPLSRMGVFRDQLAQLGYIEGRNITLGFRSAEGHLDRLPQLAETLVREGVDVIFAESTPAAIAAHKATQTIPIVAILGVDPVESGLASSLAHPGGNITGVTLFGDEAFAKRVEMAHELLPNAVRLAVITVIVTAGGPQVSVAQETGNKLGLTVDVIIVDPARIAEALSPTVLGSYDALLFAADVVLSTKRQQVLDLVAQSRKPAIFAEKSWVERGGLLSYGPDSSDAYRRCAGQLVRVLKGQNAGDVPLDRPTKFDLRINMRAARAIGLQIPPGLLARADEVIE